MPQPQPSPNLANPHNNNNNNNHDRCCQDATSGRSPQTPCTLLNQNKPNEKPDKTAKTVAGGFHLDSRLATLSLLLLFCSALSPTRSLVLTAPPINRGGLVAGLGDGGSGGDNTNDDSISRRDIETSNTSAIQRVTNLRLRPDFRAIKLTWTFAYSEANQRPPSFEVRICELTSWNFEIKCRIKKLRVLPETNLVISGKPVALTTTKPDVASELEPGVFEAHLNDLRALTNYTVQVEPSWNSSLSKWHHDISRSWAARAMPLWPPSPVDTKSTPIGLKAADQSIQVVETKPFEAELTRCLGNSSELLVHTGPFFGGRISVENSSNPACQMAGNRTSEQPSYLFRLDHKLCGSRVLDGKRVESAILVHENKDILIHNTARFLALCSFDHNKSFVIKASVALPRLSTGLVGRQQVDATPEGLQNFRPATVVRLGSMPGVYRSRQASSPPNEADPELNSIDRSHGDSNRRRSKEFDVGIDGSSGPLRRFMEVHSRPPPEVSANIPSVRSHSLTLDGALVAPRPVQVQSGVLFVERRPIDDESSHSHPVASSGSSARSARAQHQSTAPDDFRPQVRTVGSIERVVRPPTLAPLSQTTVRPSPEVPADNRSHSGSARDTRSSISTRKSKELASDEDDTALVLTNNHRVGAEISVLGVPSSSDHSAGADATPAIIKYSAAKLRPSVYFDAKLDQRPSRSDGQSRNQRTARMRSVQGGGERPEVGSSSRRWGDLESAIAGSSQESDQLTGSESSMSSNWSEGREAVTQPNPTGSSEIVEPSLAQNITGHLLRWSLRTLGNLAKKSLESLARNAANLTSDAELDELDELATSSPSVESRDASAAKGASESTDKSLRAPKKQDNHRKQSESTGSQPGRKLASPSNHTNETREPRVAQTNLKSTHLKPDLSSESEQVFTGRSASGQWSPYFGCALYGLVFLVGSMAVLLLTFWLVAPSRKRTSPSSPAATGVEPSLEPLGAHDHISGGLLSVGRDVAQHSRYPLPSSETGRHGPIRNKSSLSQVSSQSGGSRCSTNRSTSTDLTGIGEPDQRDCKNNEVFYTEHVLIDTGSRPGESYA